MDHELAGALFAAYRMQIYRFLTRLLGDAAAAEDLTQETFVRALGATYMADGRERAWLFQIARNLARDHVRAGARRTVSPAAVGEPAVTTDAAVAFEIASALTELTADDREVFLLREMGGLSYAEIAHVCGLTSDAVRSRLHRVRLMLRACLAPPCPGRP